MLCLIYTHSPLGTACPWESCVNVGPAYIRGGWWQKLKQRSKMTQIIGFRVAMTCTCTHKGPIFHYKVQTDVYCITMGAISVPHFQIGALHWHHFTSCAFTWLAKSSGKADQSTLASRSSDYAQLFSVAISWAIK